MAPWQIPQGLYNFTVGVADAASLGIGPLLRSEYDIADGGLDACSGAYKAGQMAAIAPMMLTGEGEAEVGITVLGHSPYYIRVGEEMGYNYFLAKGEWSQAENQAFLDAAIARGDEFVLASPLRDGPSVFRQELEYLASKGITF